MKPPTSAVLALMAAAVLATAAATATDRVDPRTLVPGSNATSFVSWAVGKQYRYHFTSKAAHLESPLPIAENVNAQTAVEDLGLYPFAVLEGWLLLEVKCVDRAANTLLVKVLFDRVTSDCGADAYGDNACATLNQAAATLENLPHWVTMSRTGALLDSQFDQLESPDAVAIKKEIVADFSMAEGQPGQRFGDFSRSSRDGDAIFTSDYRIRPFTRHAAAPSPSQRSVDGVVVHKTKTMARVPTPNPYSNVTASPAVERRWWVYMIVGGDVEGGVEAPVPTRISSIQEAVTTVAKPAPAGDHVYLLSRVTVELRNVDVTQTLTLCTPDGDGLKA